MLILYTVKMYVEGNNNFNVEAGQHVKKIKTLTQYKAFLKLCFYYIWIYFMFSQE